MIDSLKLALERIHGYVGSLVEVSEEIYERQIEPHVIIPLIAVGLILTVLATLSVPVLSPRWLMVSAAAGPRRILRRWQALWLLVSAFMMVAGCPFDMVFDARGTQIPHIGLLWIGVYGALTAYILLANLKNVFAALLRKLGADSDIASVCIQLATVCVGATIILLIFEPNAGWMSFTLGLIWAIAVQLIGLVLAKLLKA